MFSLCIRCAFKTVCMARPAAALFVMAAIIFLAASAGAQARAVQGPSFSHGLILFSADLPDKDDPSQSDLEVCVMRADGSTPPVVLTDNGNRDSRARWSPDGGKVAFVRDFEHIWLMNSDGSKQRYLHDGKALAFSPDGGRLAYSAFSSDDLLALDLFTHDFSSRLKVRLTSMLGNEFAPDWSPNGERINFSQRCFVSFEAPNDFSNIHTIGRRGGRSTVLTDCNRSDGRCIAEEPRWSPDGTKIAFSKYFEDPNETNIWVTDVRSGQSRQLTHFNGANYPVWSPDGKHILFSVLEETAGHRVLYLMNANGSGMRRFLNNGRTIYPWEWIVDPSECPECVDLAVGSVSGLTEAEAGAPMAVDLTIKNQGIAGCSHFAVGLFLSKDKNINPSRDIYIGKREFQALKAGSNLTTGLTARIPAQIEPGNYYLGAVADIRKEVHERSRGNNRRVSLRPVMVKSRQ